MPHFGKKHAWRTPAIVIAAFMVASAALVVPAGACGWGGENDYDDETEVTDIGLDGKPITDTEQGRSQDNASQHGGEDLALQTRLGDRYRTGVGAARDYAAAMRWYRMAADRQYAPAQNNIGVMYELGLGVGVDLTAAAKWYALAAAQGESHAQHSLGILLGGGHGVAKDLVAAAALIRKAAEQGHAGAYTDLARLYWEGLGLPRDRVQAYKWCRIAALKGGKAQLPPCDGAAAVMRRDEIDAAEAMAETWRPTLHGG